MKSGVTCCRKADSRKRELAVQWARELGLPYIPRNEEISVPAFLEELQMEQLLAVTAKGPMIYTKSGKLAYHPGMAPLRVLELERGGTDQLVKALGLRPGMRVFDGTLGLAADSIVASYAVGSEGKVVGTEAAPLLAFLLREGLKSYNTGRPVTDEAMRRIEVHSIPALEYLKKVEPDSFDVCYFDPMFQTPTRHSPSMDGLRPIAYDRALDEETVAFALRAAPMVVIKERGERSLREYGCTEIIGSSNSHFKFGRIYRKDRENNHDF